MCCWRLSPSVYTPCLMVIWRTSELARLTPVHSTNTCWGHKCTIVCWRSEFPLWPAPNLRWYPQNQYVPLSFPQLVDLQAEVVYDSEGKRSADFECSIISRSTPKDKVILMSQWSFPCLRKDLWVNIKSAWRKEGRRGGVKNKETLYITESWCLRFNPTNKFSVNILAWL